MPVFSLHFLVPHLEKFIPEALNTIIFSTEQQIVLVLMTSFARQAVTYNPNTIL
jgi:hypothetical protein